MRTTLELPNDLFRLAKISAAQRDTTLKELITEGLRLVLGQKKTADRQRLTKPPISGGKKIPALSNREIQRLFDAEEAAKLNEIYR